MKLLKIGRDSSCDIVLHSDKVSSFHAEIILLNNGDIILEDKNSRNGTFIMNHIIKPSTPVTVKRGDAIRFADTELNWINVPLPEDNSAYKLIYGIGSNFRNEIQVSGTTISRFHATLKVDKKGKTFIQDHSKNGTTINGKKIISNQNIIIRRNDKVMCGGIDVDLKNFISAPLTPKLIGIAAGLLLLIFAGMGVYNITPLIDKPSISSLEDATSCVFGQYLIEVIIKDDPFAGVKGWPEKWIFGVPADAEEYSLALGTYTNTKIKPIPYSGTAFFISKNGELGTNRHIAVPWEYISKKDEESIRLQMEHIINQIINNECNTDLKLNDVDYMRLSRLQKSQIEISGSFEYLGIALAGSNVSTASDFLSCQVVAESGDKKRDVAMLRLNNKITPEYIVKNGFFDINKARTDETSIIPQEETYKTIGYPADFSLGFFSEGAKELKPSIHNTTISKSPDINNFQIQIQAIGGQSGSPIIDNKHRLIGVLYGGFNNTNFSYGCNIKHLKELYDKHKVRK